MQSMIPPPQPSAQLLVLGLNHRTAPIALREILAFTPEQTTAALQGLTMRFPRSEAVILSTCNRVELYLAATGDTAISLDALTQFLADFHHLAPTELQSHLYFHENRRAVEHLFAVTASLDSMVVGETQILGQVKQAYALASEANAVGGGGKIFHALFQRTFAAAKDVHARTNLSAGRLSIASVAIDLARSVFDRFDDKTVLCVGAGKMASLMLRHLANLKPEKLLIINRSLPRAQSLAAEFSGEAHPFDSLDALITDADILLTSTNADTPIITESRFKSLLKARRYRPAVIIDIAVPRDVESSVGQLSNVYLYNVDDLQEVAAGNKTKRDEEIAASRTVLAEHVDNFWKWFASRDVGPIVKALYEQCHALAKAELEATLAKNPDMPLDQRAEFERLTHRLIGKLLHRPVSQLTAGADPDLLPALTAALKQLFDL